MLKILLTLLLQQLCIGVLSKKTSGFYIENEFNQTVLLEFLTPDIELQVKENILRILDIEKPQIQQKMSLIKNSSAHTFLMEVYNLLNDNNVYNLIDLNLQSELFDITIEAVNSYMKESNIIISLISHEAIIPNITKMKSKKFINLWFNLTTISSQDQLINAELKIYRRIRNVLPMYKGPITIKIYRISNLNEGEKKEEIFINSIRVIEAGWITLNITKTLNYWIQNPNENHGLTIKIHSDKQVKEIDPKKFGIVGLEENNQEKSPFMVGYFQRASDNRKKLNLSLLNFQSFDENKIRDKRTISLCRKENLYVDFHDLNWQDWMIIPRGYSANFCSGECQFPIKSEMFATNHAVIQLMVNLNDPSKVPRPCCAPSKLTPISLIYLIDNKTYVLKTKKDMSIESCACH